MNSGEIPSHCDAFIDRFAAPLVRTNDGALAGLRVAVKDNFDIAGTVTGCGNPEWAATHEAAEQNANVVSVFLSEGGVLVGKTQMDELAYSLMGQNARYGTPLNPVAPTRMPGGSSSGSASAVAANLADIGVGSDTGGSVRLPASFCGLFGWRPTHGLVSSKGMLGLAPSFDVPGFFTRDLKTMERLSSLFCAGRDVAQDNVRLRTPADMWNLTHETTRSCLKSFVTAGGSDALLDDDLRGTLLQTFRVCQGYEIAKLLGPWIRQNSPRFGPGIRERFAAAMALTDTDFAPANEQRARISAALETAIPLGTIVAYPTMFGPAPLLTVGPSELEQYRNSALKLLSVAGIAGLPQLTLPLAKVEGAPIGLSLIGAKGSDMELIAFASKITSPQ